MFSLGNFIFVVLKALDHVWLEFLILDVITWLVALENVDNVVCNLYLGGELEEVAHDG